MNSVLASAVVSAGMWFGIVGGTSDKGDPAVVAVTQMGFSMCTGTLIAPNAVLTAGHCTSYGWIPFFKVRVGSQKISVAHVYKHPNYSGEGKPNDVAILQLSKPVKGIVPATLNSQPLDARWVGKTIRNVGFGLTHEWYFWGSRSKRQLSHLISKVDSDFVYTDGQYGQTCTFDSGGPGFISNGSVASVVSDGKDCYSEGWDVRVDVVLPWIKSVLAKF